MSTDEGKILVARSAGILTWGIGLLMGGGIAVFIGVVQAARHGADGLGVAGAIASLIGLILTLYGIHNLATNVDLAAAAAVSAERTQHGED